MEDLRFSWLVVGLICVEEGEFRSRISYYRYSSVIITLTVVLKKKI